MGNPEETRKAVEGYFAAWTTKRVDEAYGWLSPNLEFAGPNARYASAEAFRPALIGFASMTRAARVIELVVQGDRAALLYDCDLPEPVGTLRIASFFRVEGGKIRWYETFFDPTALRQLQAQRAAAS
jgi:hypothetical protein